MEINRYNLYARLGYYTSDIIILYMVYHFTYLNQYNQIPFLSQQSGFIGLLSMFSWTIISFVFALNTLSSHEPTASHYSGFLAGQLLLTFVIVFTLVFTKMDISRLFLFLFLGTQCIFLYLSRAFWLSFFRTMHMAGYHIRNVFLYGTNDDYQILKKWTQKNKSFGYHLNGWFKDPGVNNKTIIDLPLEFDQIVGHSNVDHFVLDPTRLQPDHLTEAIDWAEDKGARIHLIEPQTETITRKLEVRDTFGPFAAVKLRREPLKLIGNRMLKKAFDILFSLLVFVTIYWWFYILVGLIIKLSSRGPIVIKQKRIGIDGQEFTCLKFRTMYSNKAAEKGLQHLTKKDDPRITWVGNLLRKTNLDELPQFLNVLQGDMSVVGPRPHMISEDKQIADKVKKYRIRRFVRPGITGWAAVKGFRGGTENMALMQKRNDHDLEYIENWTFGLDLKICFKTSYQMITLSTGAA